MKRGRAGLIAIGIAGTAVAFALASSREGHANWKELYPSLAKATLVRQWVRLYTSDCPVGEPDPSLTEFVTEYALAEPLDLFIKSTWPTLLPITIDGKELRPGFDHPIKIGRFGPGQMEIRISKKSGLLNIRCSVLRSITPPALLQYKLRKLLGQGY